jgi:hypothetical protein
MLDDLIRYKDRILAKKEVIDPKIKWRDGREVVAPKQEIYSA